MRGTSIILFSALLLMLCACSKQVTTSSTSEVSDSTYVREVPRLVEVFIPGDTVTLTQWIECDSATNKPKPSYAEASEGKAFLKVKVDKTGKLTASGGCDSLKRLVKTMDKEIFRLRHEKKFVTKTVTKIEYRTRWYDKAARVFSILVIIALIIYLKLK